MFVRARRKGSKLAFSVVESIRRGRDVCQRTVISVGTVLEPVLKTDDRGKLILDNWHNEILVNVQNYVDFWLKVQDKVRSEDETLWPLVRDGIGGHLPKCASYWHLDQLVLGARMRRSRRAKERVEPDLFKGDGMKAVPKRKRRRSL